MLIYYIVPSIIIGCILVYKSLHPKEYYIRRLTKLPHIDIMYKKETQKELVKIKHDILEKWDSYGKPITKIPNDALSIEKIIEIINNYSEIVNRQVKNKQLSGTIYSKSLVDNKGSATYVDEIGDQDDDLYTYLSKKLEVLFTYTFKKSYLWNSLHHNEFGIGPFIDYQVVQMVANTFGKKDDEKINGFVTSGGTESIMLMARIYRNQGYEKGITNPVIIAGESVHASLMKAGMAYNIKIVLAKINSIGIIDEIDLWKNINKYKHSLVAIVCSAPSYPKGKIDDIQLFTQIAKKYNCGLHVDCCLGGFVVNFIHEGCSNYLAIKEVTSISVDTHKNGHAPKGSSVLLIRPHLSHYGIYSIPQWSGGIYGTPKDAGSQSCVNSLTTLVAMLAIGKRNYINMAKEIWKTTITMSDIIKQNPELELLGNYPLANVVAFKLNSEFKYGATYALAKEMSNRGFVVNTLNDDSIHFCVTIRSANNKMLKKFVTVLSESIPIVKKMNDDGVKFHGDAGLYGSLNVALKPNYNKLGFKKYLINKLFGKIGADDMVKNYFVTLMDPYK